MLYKTFATLLLSATALAQSASEVEASSFETPSEAPVPFNVPNSIYTALVTAVPSSWVSDMMNPASRSAEYSRIEAGTLPAWYSNLPESVKNYASSLAMAQLGDLSAMPATPTPVTNMGTDPTSKGSSATGAQLTATATRMVTSSTPSPPTSGSKSSSSSSTQSSSSSHSPSTAGAPAATGAIAMSVAGAAGLLGIALAL